MKCENVKSFVLLLTKTSNFMFSRCHQFVMISGQEAQNGMLGGVLRSVCRLTKAVCCFLCESKRRN